MMKRDELRSKKEETVGIATVNVLLRVMRILSGNGVDDE